MGARAVPTAHSCRHLLRALGVQLEQALTEHRGAEGRAGAVVIDRGGLATQDARERPPPASLTPSPLTARPNPVAPPALSSKPRFAILWNPANRASGTGMRTAVIN